MLIGLGFKPLPAAGLSLIGNTREQDSAAWLRRDGGLDRDPAAG
jgi:hypothetical protein